MGNFKFSSLQSRNPGKQDNEVPSIRVMVKRLAFFWVFRCGLMSIFTNLKNALEGGKKLLKICECVMFPFHPLWTLTKPYLYTFILINFLERCKDAWSKLLAIRIIYSPILPHPQSDDIKLSITRIISATYKISSSGFVTSSLSVSCVDRRRFNEKKCLILRDISRCLTKIKANTAQSCLSSPLNCSYIPIILK